MRHDWLGDLAGTLRVTLLMDQESSDEAVGHVLSVLGETGQAVYTMI